MKLHRYITEVKTERMDDKTLVVWQDDYQIRIHEGGGHTFMIGTMEVDEDKFMKSDIGKRVYSKMEEYH